MIIENRTTYQSARIERVIRDATVFPPWTRGVVVVMRHHRKDRRGGFTERGGRIVWLWVWAPNARGGRPYPDADDYRSWSDELRRTAKHESVHAWLFGSKGELLPRLVEKL